MRTDLPARLRVDAAFCEACDRPGDAGMAALLREAADEIERLRALCMQIATPIMDDPTMDRLLGRRKQ